MQRSSSERKGRPLVRRRAASPDAEGSSGGYGGTAFWLAFWYATSLGTLVLNKVILSGSQALGSQTLGLAQMLSTTLMGGVKVACSGRRERALAAAAKHASRSATNLDELVEAGDAARAAAEQRRPSPIRATLVVMGALRGLTLVLGLVSLSRVPPSFTETIKSTAPLFTVVVTFLVLGQRTSGPVILSLVPVMLGLVVCAYTEVSWDAVGFWAAVANNVVDCFQNVLSKKIIGRLGPVKLQFYTSLIAIAFQLPVLAYRFYPLLPDLGVLLDPSRRSSGKPWDHGRHASPAAFAALAAALTPAVSGYVATLVALNVTSYHLQSVSAYYVVDRLHPVTTSVANTLKRAVLIVLTILYFGNRMTAESVGGVVLVIAGVIVYNWARARYPVDDAPGDSSSTSKSTRESS